MPEGQKRIIKALRALAECIDQLENISPEVKLNKNFRSRRQLVDDILTGKE